LGIGTTSPATILNVSRDSGLATGTGTTVAVRIGDTSNDAGAGTWNTTQQFSAVQFFSADTSGVGAAVRASVGATMESVFGSPSALTFFTNGGTNTEKMRLDSAGNLGLGVTPSNANGGVLQLKSGITFPATAVAATDANTLDDYEEGTWSPTITNVSGTYTTTSVNYGQYTKIGEVVYGFLSVTVTASGTASDSMNFTLPFVPAREGSGTGRENVNTGDILISRIVTGGGGEGRLYKSSGAAAGAGTGTYVVSFMFLT
jgi:hypothetical protein